MEPNQKYRIFLVKRLWDTDELLAAFIGIIDFFLLKKDVDYEIYVEAALTEHKVLEVYKQREETKLIFTTTPETQDFELVITIGGDGTILWAHKILAREVLPPFMCFDGGSLCFLSNFSLTKYEESLIEIHSGIVTNVEFNTFELPRVKSFLKSQNGEEPLERNVHYSLNEVVVERRTPYIVKLDLYINGHFAITFNCDGMLVSSSTGSTAYNLSLANGCILHPDAKCLIVNAIAPMSLSFRPVIVPSDATIMIKLNESSRSEPRITYDGNSDLNLTKEDEFVLKLGESSLKMVCPKDYKNDEKWLQKLRELRGWK